MQQMLKAYSSTCNAFPEKNITYMQDLGGGPTWAYTYLPWDVIEFVYRLHVIH